MQKPGLEKLWQLVGTRVHYRRTAKPKGGFRIAARAYRVIASTALALPILCLVANLRVAAQIRPDATLPRNSIVTSRGNTIKIDGGTQAGSNLFHSFSQFSVPTGGTAFFNNAAGISNIFSRVTGGFISNIDGILKANGTANLFLINPNGIIFGPNATLNIGGSFAATTANAIQFGNQGGFSATNPNNPALLTIDPSALLFNQIAERKISNISDISNQARLQVNQGGSLLLVGGNVSLDGGSLLARGGRVELGGLAAPGMIELNVERNNLSLSFPSNAALSNISLTNAAQINTRAGGGGDIAITAQNLRISGGSTIQTGISSGMGSPTSKAGDLNINVPGIISMTGSSKINNQVLAQGIGDSGNINITTGNLQATDGSFLLSRNLGMGNGGNVTVVAKDTISFDGVDSDGSSSGVYSNVRLESTVGNGGNINLTARSLFLTNGAQLSANTSGRGNAGNINITATDAVKFDGVFSDGSPSGAYALVDSTAIGNGGNINIKTSDVSVTNGAQLVANTFGQGNAGNVSITANTVSFDGANLNGQSGNGISSGIYVRVGSRGIGKGGSISVAAESFSLTNGAQLAATTRGRGTAGDILIISPNVIISGLGIDGSHSGLFTSALNNSAGNGGNIDIHTSRLNLTDLGQISAQSQGTGTAGTITIQADRTLNVNNGEIIAGATRSSGGNINITASDVGLHNNSAISTSASGTGNGGNLSITTSQLTIRNGAQVTASSQGTGNAGDILNIQANILTLDNGSITTTSPSGNGGNINNIQVRDLLLLRNNSRIATSAGTQSSGGGNGGNITINAPFIVAPAVENSKIIANAYQGNGGNIQINSQSLFGIKYSSSLTPESHINASSQFGQSGIVQINTPTVNPAQGLLALPTQVVDASTSIAKNCSEAVGENQFIITGRGGLPPNPDEVLSSDTVWEDTHSSAPTANQQRISAATITKASAATARIISPATGWVFNEFGQVMLVATAPASSFYNPWLNATTCLGE